MHTSRRRNEREGNKGNFKIMDLFDASAFALLIFVVLETWEMIV